MAAWDTSSRDGRHAGDHPESTRSDSLGGDEEAAVERTDFIASFTYDLIDNIDDENSGFAMIGGGCDLFTTPCDLAEGLLCGAARLLGDLWLTDETDFVVVTLATHRLTNLLMQLEEDPAAFGFPPAGPPGLRRLDDRVALMAATDDQHGFGLSMLGYRLRQADYRVHVAESEEDLRDYVIRAEPLAIGLSASHTASAQAAIAIATDLRNRCAPRRLNIAFGGPAFATGQWGDAIEVADLVGQSSDEMLNWLDHCTARGEVSARSIHSQDECQKG